MRPTLTNFYRIACVVCGQIYTTLALCARCDRPTCGHCIEDDLCLMCAVQRDKEERDDETP